MPRLLRLVTCSDAYQWLRWLYWPPNKLRPRNHTSRQPATRLVNGTGSVCFKMPRRSNIRHACWTCRLRRKKCDGARPTCQACATLDIPCHNDADRPQWMDGASEQQYMIGHMKSLIKDGAESRRRRNAAEERAFIVTSLSDFTDSERSLNYHPTHAEFAPDAPEANGSGRTTIHVTETTLTSDSPSIPYEPKHPDNWSVSLGKAWELDFTMMYLDYVFPFLFPFYRPPLVATGRAWILRFVRQNRTVLHSALSLSCFFFTHGLHDVFPDVEAPCRSVMWGQVEDQASMSFEMLQAELANMNDPSSSCSFLQKAQMMETILHVLLFDVFVGRSDHWRAHLAPACTLFEELLNQKPLDLQDGSQWLFTLQQISWPRPVFPGFARQLWNPDQAAFRFFTALIMFIDIIASTSLRKRPKLTEYHDTVIGEVRPEVIAEWLDMSSFFGCKNRVILGIRDIASLGAWRRETQTQMSIDDASFHVRAEKIRQTLELDLEAPGAACDQANIDSQGRGKQLQPYFTSTNHYASNGQRDLITGIWANAALIYLHSMTLGIDPSNENIQSCVARVYKLTKQIDSVAQIRTLAWPVCVAGCLAQDSQEEQAFKEITNMAGDIQLRSALNEAGRIMEAVWKRRKAWAQRTVSVLDMEWDIGDCLNVLGSPALLI